MRACVNAGFARAFAALAGLALSSGASAYTVKTIYSFCAQSNCRDGFVPLDGMTADGSGNFYGVTIFGGKFGASDAFDRAGTVYMLSPTATAGPTRSCTISAPRRIARTAASPTAA